MRTIRALLLPILIALCFPTALFSEIKPDHLLFGDDDPNIPWQITADEIEHDRTTLHYTAKGHVKIVKGDKTLLADIVHFDHKRMNVSAEGNVIITSGGDILSGKRIDADLNAGTGIVYDGNLFIRENHFIIRSDRIEKIDKSTYTAHQASITSCDGETPTWKITGKDMKITPGSYGFVSHSAFWVKNIPIAYIPFMVFPVKRDRQSGLLAPEFGRSDSKGIEYTQPLYWVIDDDSDATLYYQYMEKRGDKIGLEYRHIGDNRSKSMVMLDLLNDAETADSRPNSDRYWFRMKHDQPMPMGFFGRLDLDLVSDREYLKDFKSGYTGFDKTQGYFREIFNREIDDYTDASRLNRVSVSKSGTTYSLDAQMRWYDNPTMRRLQDEDTSLHELPMIRFASLKQPIFRTPVYWGLDSEYVYFYREAGVKGHRTDLYPRIYMPFQYKPYLSIEPSVGMRETLWFTDNDFGSNENSNREIYDARLDLSTSLEKTYQTSENRKLRHRIIPQIVYEYASVRRKKNYPYFDPLDKLGDQNQITYSLTNLFTLKSERQKADPSQGVDTLYHQFGRFKIAQSYYLGEEPRPLGSNINEDENMLLSDHTLSPIYAEIELYPFPYLSLEADAEWSHYDGEFKSRNISTTLSDTRGDRLITEYRYTQDFSESLYLNLSAKLTDKIIGYADYERNLHDEHEIRNSLGFVYLAPCWSVDIRHSNEEGDHRYSVLVNLYGLGGIGSGR